MTDKGQGKSPKNHTPDERVGRLEKRFLDLRARIIDWWYRFIGVILAFLTVVVGLFAILAALFGYLSYSELEGMKNEATELVSEIESMKDELESERNEAAYILEKVRTRLSKSLEQNRQAAFMLEDLERTRYELGNLRDEATSSREKGATSSREKIDRYLNKILKREMLNRRTRAVMNPY